MTFWRPGCAEFPNDNPALHAGVRWLPTWTRGFPQAQGAAESGGEQAPAPAALSGNLAAPAGLAAPSPSAERDEPRALAPHAAVEPLGVALEPDVPEVQESAPDEYETGPGSESAAEVDPFILELQALVAPVLKTETGTSSTPCDALKQPLLTEAASALRSSTPFRVPHPSQVMSPLTHLTASATLELDLTPPPPGCEGWQQLLAKLSDYLLARGATRAAAAVGPLLSGERVDLTRLGPRVTSALVASGIVDRHGRTLRPSVRFQAAATELRESFSAGGGNPRGAKDLCVTLVTGLLASAAGPETISAQLRQAGLDALLDRAA